MRFATTVALAIALGFCLGLAWAERAATITHYPGSAYFEDCSPSSPHDQDIGFLVESGVTQGTDATHYSPTWPVTRDQMASYLMRQTVLDYNAAWVLIDALYFDGYYTGYAAYQAGRITWEEYQAYEDFRSWLYQLETYQLSQLTAASRNTLAGAPHLPANLLTAGRLLADATQP